jgi:hypothetical protein
MKLKLLKNLHNPSQGNYEQFKPLIDNQGASYSAWSNHKLIDKNTPRKITIQRLAAQKI